MKRRTFFQLLSLPALAPLWPRTVAAAKKAAPTYTDDRRTADMTAIADDNRATGIYYEA